MIHNRYNGNSRKEERECQCCGKKFTTYFSKNKIFCSRECGNQGKLRRQKDRILKYCEICGKEFAVVKSEYKRRKCCSIKCGAIANGIKGARTYWFYSLKSDKILHCNSSWEIITCEILEKLSNVKYFDRCRFHIDYFWNGKTHIYVPDILVTYCDDKQEIIEVKPSMLLNDLRISSKINALSKYCDENKLKYSIWTENEIFTKLGGDKMNRGFLVKTKTQKKMVNGKIETIPTISWMKVDFPYCVLSIWKWQTKDKESGNTTVFTKFLIGDQETGIMHWVDAHGIDFVGVV